MEEPGNLDIEMFNVQGNPQGGDSFLGTDVEFEYGVKGWWTTEFYLDGQATAKPKHNLYRVPLGKPVPTTLHGEHWINPVLYAEFEDTSADKTIREVVGHDGLPDFLVPNWLARMDKERELELKLILGSNVRGWNISENFIAEKNLAGDPWEFGYAFGVSRPLQLAASARECAFCRGEVSSRLGNVWRLGRHRRFRAAPDFAVSGPDCQLDCAKWNDRGIFAAVRTERLQHSRVCIASRCPMRSSSS